MYTNDRILNSQIKRLINRKNFLENQKAYHSDRIDMQFAKEKITNIWAPGIGSSAGYQTYVEHIIDRHQMKINEIDYELNIIYDQLKKLGIKV